jgi:hypothetical protein
MHLCDLYCDCYARSPGSISKFNLIPACTTYTVCLVQHTPNYLICKLLCTIFLILLEQTYHESTFKDSQSTAPFTHQSSV